jgi:hypothetical protein
MSAIALVSSTIVLWDNAEPRSIELSAFTETGTESGVGWATRYIEELQRGTTVQFRPRGNSMAGKIDSGQLVTVQPTGEHELKVGTIVLCKVGRAQYLHLIKAIRGQQYQIGNNRGGINGWTTRKGIYGVVTEIV